MKNEFVVDGDLIFIKLNSPKYGDREAVIDKNDFEKVNAFPNKWSLSIVGKLFYARQKISRKDNVYLHHCIRPHVPGYVVDHINRDSLDNRKSNLRLIQHYENLHNTNKPVNNKSGFKSVFWNTNSGYWEAAISIKGKHHRVGTFNTPEEAAEEAEKARRALLNGEPLQKLYHKQRNNTSGYIGVSWINSKKRFVANIQHDGKNYYLGSFKDPKEAALAYKHAAEKLGGKYAHVNNV